MSSMNERRHSLNERQAEQNRHRVEHLNAFTSFWLRSNWKEHAHGERFSPHCPQNMCFANGTVFRSRLVSVAIPSQTSHVFFLSYCWHRSRRSHRTQIVIKLLPNQWIDNIWYVLQLNVSMLVDCAMAEEYVRGAFGSDGLWLHTTPVVAS